MIKRNLKFDINKRSTELKNLNERYKNVVAEYEINFYELHEKLIKNFDNDFDNIDYIFSVPNHLKSRTAMTKLLFLIFNFRYQMHHEIHIDRRYFDDKLIFTILDRSKGGKI